MSYKNQYFEVEKQLENMLNKLPTKSEVAELLVEVSQVGLSIGLKFKLFKPMTGQEKRILSRITYSNSGSWRL